MSQSDPHAVDPDDEERHLPSDDPLWNESHYLDVVSDEPEDSNIRPETLAALNTLFIIGFGSWEVMRGSLSLGTLAAFEALSAGFAAPIYQLVGLGVIAATRPAEVGGQALPMTVSTLAHAFVTA